MFASSHTRRGALLSLAGLAAVWLSACNTPRTGANSPAPDASAVKIAAIKVDVSDVVAETADPTATWVQSSLPGALAKAFAAHMAPDDPAGATLEVKISSVTLGAVAGGAGAIDWMNGSATLKGGGAEAEPVNLSATITFSPSALDVSLERQAMQRRVQALCDAFASWLPRKLNM